MQSVFEIVGYELTDDPYEDDFEYSWGLGATLAEAVAFIEETLKAGVHLMTVEDDTGLNFVRIIERAVGLFHAYPSGKDPRILARYDWRGELLKEEQ